MVDEQGNQKLIWGVVLMMNMAKPAKIPTGCKSLDEMLGGGIETDTITEIFGEAGSGKTNLCLVLAKNVVLSGKKVMYIDTEGISAERLEQICGKDADKIAREMLVARCYSLEEQQAMVEEAVKKARKENVGLVILDSGTVFYRINIGMEEEAGERQSLAGMVNALSKLARTESIPVVITNQVYMDVKKGTFEPIDGAMLQHNAKIIIRFEKLADGKRRAVLLKHRSLPEGREALFTITQNGIE
ncbi:MAG: DNA repair and recombination protein RadB [Thermoplasmata archaeon]|nr:DNA repair and recombination protein RadB [Thermoplasmata archaeon]